VVIHHSIKYERKDSETTEEETMKLLIDLKEEFTELPPSSAKTLEETKQQLVRNIFGKPHKLDNGMYEVEFDNKDFFWVTTLANSFEQARFVFVDDNGRVKELDYKAGRYIDLGGEYELV
jgi:hypothetical protein